MKKVIKNLYTIKGAPATERVNELRTRLGLGTTSNSTEFVEHALATAASDFIVASGSGVFVKKTLAETKAILYASATPAVISIPATTTRAISIGTKGTSYANSTALAITSIGGTLDTDPANNYMVGVFTKVSGDEATGATDDLGSAWFRTRTNTGTTTPSGYSLYGVKSQLRIYSAASAGATVVANWAAAGILGVLEVSGAATSFSSGCIAAAVYGNVALGTGSTIDSGAVVSALAAISASSAISANADDSYYGLYVGKSGAVVFDVGVRVANSSCTTGISIGTCTTGIDIAATCTNAINIAAAASVTNLIKFDALAGCIYNVDVSPTDTPSDGGLGADACLKIDIGGQDYFIPIFATELS